MANSLTIYMGPESGFYGMGVAFTGLTNRLCGHASTSGSNVCAARFRADHSGSLSTFRWYQMASGGGYGGGTGGTRTVTIQADDGTSDHFPSASVLATQACVANQVSNVGMLYTFDTPATLVAGTLYHVVWTNTDADPETNYFSVNCLWHNSNLTNGGQLNPRFANTDWAHNFKDGATWTPRLSFIPILDLGYSDGHHQGLGYVEGSHASGYPAEIVGTSKMAREYFTLTSGRVVVGAGIALCKIAGGTDALTVGLYTSADALLDSFTIPAASVPDGTAPTAGSGEEILWVSGSFAIPKTLTGGAYYLRFSTAAGTTYWAWAARKGVESSYNAATYFADGEAQKTTNGSTWTTMLTAGNDQHEMDLMAYLI